MLTTFVVASILAVSSAQASQSQTGRLIGHVVDADSSAPISGVEVHVLRSTPTVLPPGVIDRGRSPLPATTDNSGSFEMELGTFGNYWIDLPRAAGYWIDRTDASLKHFTIASNEVIEITVRMSRTAVIAGTVLHNDGTAASNARVKAIWDPDGRLDQLKNGGGITNDSGEFHFEVRPGRYALYAASRVSPDVEPSELPTYYSNATTIADAARMDVTADRPILNLRFALSAGHRVSVSGVVIRQSGEPAVGIVIWLQGSGFLAFGEYLTPATTNANGQFRVTGATPGIWTASYSTDGPRMTLVENRQIIVADADVRDVKLIVPF